MKRIEQFVRHFSRLKYVISNERYYNHNDEGDRQRKDDHQQQNDIPQR
jgi:hypothetical protein